MKYIISFAIGFGFGIIPFSYLIGRLKGIDLKEVGSGNIGATNLGRSFGLPFFLLGFVLDGLKGLIPIFLARSFLLPAAMAGLGAILGHMFNPFFQLRGGKGVATTIGVALGLVPYAFIISLIAWLIVYFTTYLVSFASITLVVILPLTALVLHEGQILDRILVLVIGLFVIFGHRSNIKKLLSRQEPRTVLWKKKRLQ